MSPEVSRAQHECHDLATAFARNELDGEGQQRLYDLLRAPGEQGRAHAAVAWRALAMDTDLRSHLGRQALTQAVELRLNEGASQGFMQAVFRRLGWSRPTLSPVSAPMPTPLPRRGVKLLLLGLGLLFMVVAVLLVFRSGPQAQILSATGVSRHNGVIIAQGQSLSPGVLAVSAGAQIQLRLAGGAELRLHGPAQATIAEASLALASGLVELRSVEAALDIGGPEGALRLEPQSHALLQVRDGAMSAGLEQGAARVHDDQDQQWYVQPGEAYHRGQVFPWRRDGSHLPARAQWYSDLDPLTSHWVLRGRWQPSMGQTLRLDWGDGETLISPHELQHQGQSWRFSGAPLRERRFRLERFAGRTRLFIDGLDSPVVLRQAQPPQITSSDATALYDLHWGSGPQVPDSHEEWPSTW